MDWQKLIAALVEDGMTQAEIADEIGVTQSYISKLANGSICSPAYEHGAELTRLFGKRGFSARALHSLRAKA